MRNNLYKPQIDKSHASPYKKVDSILKKCKKLLFIIKIYFFTNNLYETCLFETST